MAPDAEIWRLPGPGSFVDEIARTVLGGRHVAAVLPRYLAGDGGREDALAVAVLDRLHNSDRVQPWPGDGPLAEAFARQVVYGDDVPVTVPDLLSHEDVQGRQFVCVASDLEEEHRAELPEFM